MLESYFKDRHGLQQSDEVKREIVVSAVLEIVKAGGKCSDARSYLSAKK
ncbi:hypothetical protein [Mixta sp. Marseille-Q2659]|nr:hypothetical protein [Mixta sp. Marseille-Q2659]